MTDHKWDNKHEKKSDESISSLISYNQLITSAKQTYNHFNNFYTSVTEKINRNIVKAEKTHLSYLGSEIGNTIFLSPAVTEDVEDLISSMKTNEASGPNSIPTKIKKKTCRFYFVFQVLKLYISYKNLKDTSILHYLKKRFLSQVFPF